MVKNVLEYLENSAERFPDKIAVQNEKNKFTYAELLRQAQAVGTCLARMRCYRQPVMVLVDRTPESIVLFMGVVYSGNFYVPVDNSLPGKRIELIRDALQPCAVTALAKDSKIADSLGLPAAYIYEEMICGETDIQLLETIRSQTLLSDPVCCMFTSGSTGIPKGVLKSHRSIICMAENFTELFGFHTKDIFGNQAPFDFDVSNKDIYISMKNGASVVIIPKAMFVFPAKLISYLNTYGVTTAVWAVSALSVVANLRAMKKEKPEQIKRVLFSGEVIPAKVLNYWKNALPDASYVNLYGPTEMTGNVTYFKIEKELAADQILPVGKLFPDTRILLLDENNQPVREGETGEICISGSCLASGYYNNPEKTAEVFVQNPLQNKFPEIIYKTGDLGYLNQDGDYVYVCRKDFQIKHMGHRIELAEIEVAVNAVAGIASSCCLYDKAHEKIVLFYQSEKECTAEITAVLADVLPKYMQPNKYIWLAEMPLNAHAKTDRVRLAEEYF